MADERCILLETKAFDEFIDQRESILQRFNDIQNEFGRIRDALLNEWKGKGADAFSNDAKIVAKNIGDISDILRTMCDTLRDCKEVFSQCDSKLGEHNREAKASK